MPKISWTYDHGYGDFTITGIEKDGLIVHKGTDKEPCRGWLVSHVKSGLAASPWFRLRKEAVACRDAFLALGNWTRTKEALHADVPFCKAVKNIQNGIQNAK